MPVFLSAIFIGAIVLFAIVFSAKALHKRWKAKRIKVQAENLLKSATERLYDAHNETKDTLDDLGQLKLNAWSQQVGRFADLFEWLKDIEILGTAQVGELQRVKEELVEIKRISFNAREIAQGGAAALGAGALAGLFLFLHAQRARKLCIGSTEIGQIAFPVK